MPGKRGRPAKRLKRNVVIVQDERAQEEEDDIDRGGQSGLGLPSLSLEAVALILDQLPLADLKSLRLVEKSWKSTVHPLFDSRAVVVLNSRNVMKLKTKDDEGMEFSISSVKLNFPLGERWRSWDFGKYRNRVLVFLEKMTVGGGGGALEEVIVGELDATVIAQTMFLRQVFSLSPDLKKCVDMDGRTHEVFVAHQEQKQIDQREGEVDGFLLLPPETKLKILEHLSLEDLKLVTLVNQAWRSAASTMMGKKAMLILKSNSDCLDNMLENQEKFWFNTFLIHFKPGAQRGRDCRFLEYQKKVLNLLRTKVVGGGAAVEELTICEFHVNLSLQTEFLQELFTLCSNVKMLCIDRKDDLLGNCEELPVLEYCKTVKLVVGRKRTPLATGIVRATPNVERLILGKNTPRMQWGWEHLSSVEGVSSERLPVLGLDDLTCPLRARAFSSLIIYSHFYGQLLVLFTKYADSLEVFDVQLPGSVSFTTDTQAVRPVMTKLHTLSLIDTNPRYFPPDGFIFGELRRHWIRMGLNTHFPVLHTFRFTFKNPDGATNEKNCISLLQYFPPMLDGGQVFPNITTLELSWPNPEEKFTLWRDWTRRAAIMFPNVKNNQHINRWKAMQLETPDVVGNGPDEVEQKWQRHLQQPLYYY